MEMSKLRGANRSCHTEEAALSDTEGRETLVVAGGNLPLFYLYLPLFHLYFTSICLCFTFI